MPYFLSPLGNAQSFDSAGNPLVGGSWRTFLAGTTTPATTFTSQAGTVQQGTTMTLDAMGLPVNGPVWMLGAQALKFRLSNASGVQLDEWDNISGIGDTNATPDEWVLFPAAPTYVSATSFTLAGDQTNIFQPRRRLKSTNTGGIVYSTIVSAVFATTSTTVTVTNTSGVLDAGLSAVSYGLLAANNSSIPDFFNAIYTTAGTNTAYTITPSPAIAAYTAGQSFFVNFNAASGVSPTIQISGVATPPQLIKENADGTYSNIAPGDFPANHRSRVTLISTTQALVERLNGRGWELVTTATASASATIDFTGFSGTDDDYMVSVRNCVPATDDSAIYMRVSQAGAFKTDATYNYAGLSVNASATTAAISAVGGTLVQLTGSISSTAVEGGTTGDVEVSSCSGTTANKAYRYDFEYFRTTVGTHHNKGGGAYRGSAAAVDGIRIYMSAGNITSGTFLLYKRRKA